MIESDYGKPKEKKTSIVVEVRPKNSEEVIKMGKIEKKHPRMLVLFYGGKR